MKKSDSDKNSNIRRLRIVILAVLSVALIATFVLQYCTDGGQNESGENDTANNSTGGATEETFGSTTDDSSGTTPSATSGDATNGTESVSEGSAESTDTSNQAKDEIITNLYENQVSDVQVQGTGTVVRLLEDDDVDGRHQRFILELDSGLTLLIAHNIDVAPRLDGLDVGDNVEFYGEYYYSEEGGGVHWTHRDSFGEHAGGYLKWNGETYD